METNGGTIATFGSATPAITTTLASTDRVVVIVSKAGSAGTPSVSGLGGTWVTNVSNATTFDLYIFSTSSVTGTGTVTVNVGSSAGDYALYVLRSDVANAVVFTNGAATNVAAASGGATLSLASASTLAGSMHLVAGYASGGVLSLPHSSASPNTGFTTDRSIGTNGLYLSRSVPADESITAVMSSDIPYNGALARANYYDNHVPTGGGPSPLTSTFIGWGNPIF